ncbi:MAG: selenium cofactor biosynthesis protein YqeC, partial [Aggregatilineales bacterium]
FLYRRIIGDKAFGLSVEAVNALADAVDSDVTLIEADGARRLPFKAPYGHEPAIPADVSLVVPVAGLDALGQPLDNQHVYNAEAMIAQFGYPPGERVKAPWIASVLRDAELGLKGAPETARVVVLINKVPATGYRRGRARLIAQLILRSERVRSVAIGEVQAADPIREVRRRIGAIVLAGGLSSRMGQPKMLMPWDNRPVLNTILGRLRNLRLDDTVVVTGHAADRVRTAAMSDGVRCVHNPQYNTGEMLSSLQTGLRALGPQIAACLVVLGDQPQMEARVVSEILTAYAEGRGMIVAPSYQHRRGHPILIGHEFWQEILDLPPGRAPRDVINAHSDVTAYVDVANDSILRDIDTPEDYARERRLAGLT